MNLGDRIRSWLNKRANPSFDCEDCIGMREHGCWCDAMGAVAPNTAPRRWHLTLRRLLNQGKAEP